MRLSKRLIYIAHRLQTALADGLKIPELDEVVKTIWKFRKTQLAAKRRSAIVGVNIGTRSNNCCEF